MRKGYNGLSGQVTNELHRTPTDGSVYVFFNIVRDKVKLFIWDIDGYVIYSKRLERGRFEDIVKGSEQSTSYTMQYKHLVMLHSGISLVGMHQKVRYDLSKISNNM